MGLGLILICDVGIPHGILTAVPNAWFPNLPHHRMTLEINAYFRVSPPALFSFPEKTDASWSEAGLRLESKPHSSLIVAGSHSTKLSLLHLGLLGS